MNKQNRLYKIAKRILSDLNFNTREQLDDYLKKYPNTRPDTKFFVDGIEVKVDSQSKKRQKNNSIVDNILKKHSFLKGEKGMVNIYKKILEKEGNIDNIPERAKEAAFNFVNSQLGKGNELSRKNFDLLFESGLEAFKEEFLKDERKEEEERRKEEEKREIAKEEIITSVLSDKSTESKLRTEYERIKKIEEEDYEKRSDFLEKFFESIKPIYEKWGLDKEDFLKGQYVTWERFEKFKEKIVIQPLRTFGNDKRKEILDKVIPDFQGLYEETNEKLKKRGLPEIDIEEFRKRYNRTKFPLLSDELCTKKELEEFCLKNISEKFVCRTNKTYLTAVSVNTMQKIKRQFPNLYKVRIGGFGVGLFPDEKDKNIAAYVTNDNYVMSLNIEPFTFDELIDGHRPGTYTKNGKCYKLGRSYGGRVGYNQSPKQLATYLTTHEMGHLTKSLFFVANGSLGFEDTGRKTESGKIIKKPHSTNPKCQKIQQAIEDLYNESLENGDIFKLTWYASTEPEEFWAEIFSMYYNDKSLLPPNILTKLEEIINALKS